MEMGQFRPRVFPDDFAKSQDGIRFGSCVGAPTRSHQMTALDRPLHVDDAADGGIRRVTHLAPDEVVPIIRRRRQRRQR